MTSGKDLARAALLAEEPNRLCADGCVCQSAWSLAVETENYMLNQALGNKSHTQLGWKSSTWQAAFLSGGSSASNGTCCQICL